MLTDVFDPSSYDSIEHVAVAERADVVVVAPATANTIARMALGLADDPLTTTVLATAAPVIVCPAMDGHMYEHPATARNVETLRSRGVVIAGPAEGRLASGLTGVGRMIEVPEIVGHVRWVLGRGGDLAGRKVVVSAGGTREALDPVRFISNRSSGKMGYAVAEAARDRGADTVVVAAPNNLPDPVGARVVSVASAQKMLEALTEQCGDADALVMAAAVSDWRPAEAADAKIKKGDSDRMVVNLVKTPDVIAAVPGDGLVKVGFAAETDDNPGQRAGQARSQGARPDSGQRPSRPRAAASRPTRTRVVLIDREGRMEELGLMSKYDVGNRILDRVVELLG